MTKADRVWLKSTFSGTNGSCVEVSDPRWHTSSFSGTGGSCVEVAEADDVILVRNSNHPERGTLEFTRAEMDAWVKGCAAGEFNNFI